MGVIETEAREVQRVGAVIRNCGAQLFWEHDSRRSFPLWKPYLGRHCHRRWQLYRVGQERASPSVMHPVSGIPALYHAVVVDLRADQRPLRTYPTFWGKIVSLATVWPGVIGALVHEPLPHRSRP